MIIKYSLDLFLNDIEGICKVVVVLAEQYRQDFKEYADRVTFADPGRAPGLREERFRFLPGGRCLSGHPRRGEAAGDAG